ncbi:MAG: hypothetical protein ABL921_18040 [Pirellula sp.]
MNIDRWKWQSNARAVKEPRIQSMYENLFTNHVLQLGAGDDQVPDEVLGKLASRLRLELRRRRLLRCNPSVFGLSGTSLREMAPFQDLLNDCYVDIFFGVGKNAGRKLAALLIQAQAGNSIDALIQHSLHHYVHDLHTRAFPKSAGVYKNVLGAATALIRRSGNEVCVLSSTEQTIRVSSVLGSPGSTSKVIERSRLVRSISESTVWPDALRVVCKPSRSAVEKTALGVLELIRDGVQPFVVEQLKDAVESMAYELAATPAEWLGSMDSDSEQEFPKLIRTFLDEHSYESRQAKLDEFLVEAKAAILRECPCSGTSSGTSSGTGSGPKKGQVQETLCRILDSFAEKCRHASPEHVISQSQVAGDLGIAKQTMSDYMKLLRRILARIS